MGKVIAITVFEHQRAARRCQAIWKSKFPEPLTPETMMGDLSDRTVYALANQNQEMMALVADLNAAALGLGTPFGSLDSADKMTVLDGTVYFVDQVRWECLNRLGWASEYAAEKHSLVALLMDFSRIRETFAPRFPELRPSHPRHAEFEKRRHIDAEALLRSMIPACLAAFSRRVE